LEKLTLIQTDTTVGFISKNSEILAKRKNRPTGKEFLKVIASFRELKNIVRVPKKFRRKIRYSKKTTFIYKNSISVRVVKDGEHNRFLKKYGYFFSSSANISGDRFERDIAENLADIICEDKRGFFEITPSKIVKIEKNRAIRIR